MAKIIPRYEPIEAVQAAVAAELRLQNEGMSNDMQRGTLDVPAQPQAVVRRAAQSGVPLRTKIERLSKERQSYDCFELAFGKLLLSERYPDRPLYLGVSYATYLAHAVVRNNPDDRQEAFDAMKKKVGPANTVTCLAAADWMLHSTNHIDKAVKLWGYATAAWKDGDPEVYEQLRQWQIWACIRADGARTKLQDLKVDNSFSLVDFYEQYKDSPRMLTTVVGAQALAMVAYAMHDLDLGCRWE